MPRPPLTVAPTIEGWAQVLEHICPVHQAPRALATDEDVLFPLGVAGGNKGRPVVKTGSRRIVYLDKFTGDRPHSEKQVPVWEGWHFLPTLVFVGPDVDWRYGIDGSDDWYRHGIRKNNKHHNTCNAWYGAVVAGGTGPAIGMVTVIDTDIATWMKKMIRRATANRDTTMGKMKKRTLRHRDEAGTVYLAANQRLDVEEDSITISIIQAPDTSADAGFQSSLQQEPSETAHSTTSSIIQAPDTSVDAGFQSSLQQEPSETAHSTTSSIIQAPDTSVDAGFQSSLQQEPSETTHSITSSIIQAPDTSVDAIFDSSIQPDPRQTSGSSDEIDKLATSRNELSATSANKSVDAMEGAEAVIHSPRAIQLPNSNILPTQSLADPSTVTEPSSTAHEPSSSPTQTSSPTQRLTDPSTVTEQQQPSSTTLEPSSSPTQTSSPNGPDCSALVNGDFSNGLAGWTVEGSNAPVSEIQETDVGNAYTMLVTSGVGWSDLRLMQPIQCAADGEKYLDWSTYATIQPVDIVREENPSLGLRARCYNSTTTGPMFQFAQISVNQRFEEFSLKKSGSGGA
ncbi:unnamed protein product [Parascedosporium putredinis]|uniref:Uncharacterized protein n=1 Tax=Parascedosporium putredinis TaxID=1442378 RepID=A0A9P1GXM6_9PEZI|nr:unnamed protein product [Parascedosporium putredinis]CAI7989991.1 unnamed protein product [Parascedosporium putredinis]